MYRQCTGHIDPSKAIETVSTIIVWYAVLVVHILDTSAGDRTHPNVNVNVNVKTHFEIGRGKYEP